MPTVAEVQIHLRDIFVFKEQNHRYYELRRASSIADLLAENEAALSRVNTQLMSALSPEVSCSPMHAPEVAAAQPEIELVAREAGGGGRQVEV